MRTDFATLRADLIGTDAVITTPFGKRRVTYAGDVASGRALRSVEDRVASLALPLYANTHTEDSATGAHSTHLTHHAAERLSANPQVRLLGNPDAPRLAFLSLLVLTGGGQQLHPRFVVRLLNDLFGIQARGG